MLEQLIAQFGAPAVLVGCFLEGEAAAILGGLIAHRGHVTWPVIAALAATGAFLSDQMWFALSRLAPAGGRLGALRARALRSPLRPRLERHRTVMTLAFRFLPGARIAGPVLLAQLGQSWPRFAALDALSVSVWAVIWTGLGYHSGAAVEALLGRLHPHHWGLMVLALGAAGFAAHFWLRRRSARQAADQA